MSFDPTLSLEHLQAELARLDARLQREVYRWRLAGAPAWRGTIIHPWAGPGCSETPTSAGKRTPPVRTSYVTQRTGSRRAEGERLDAAPSRCALRRRLFLA